MNISSIIKVLAFIIILILIYIFGSYYWKDYQLQQEAQNREAMYSQILDGASTKPINLSINYNNQISDGSPLVFGGNHAPESNQQDAWDKVAESGITMVRKDFFPENALPKKFSIEEYKSNVGNIQDVNNWNKIELDKINDTYINAHKRGIKTMGIVAYAPAWLTYAGKIYGIPKDWDVYENIVKNSYKYYRNNLDYVEIWNEPNFNFFFKLEGSNMSAQDAYKEIFYHASKAIREVDHDANDGKIIPIGGPVSANAVDASMLDSILSDSRTKDKLDFVSYHNYDASGVKEPSWTSFKNALIKYNKEDLPIYITEWNSEPDSKTLSPLNTSDEAISYTGDKLIDFLKMGLAGANYHVIESLDIKRENKGEGLMGYYRWENGKAELLPQAKTWRLMSEKMKLGKGPSNIYGISNDNSEINGLGFKNSANQYGSVIVNKSNSTKMTTINFENTGFKHVANVSIYTASSNDDSTKATYNGQVKVNKGIVTLIVYVPKQSVVGVNLTEDKEWFDFLNL